MGTNEPTTNKNKTETRMELKRVQEIIIQPELSPSNFETYIAYLRSFALEKRQQNPSVYLFIIIHSH